MTDKNAKFFLSFMSPILNFNHTGMKLIYITVMYHV